MDQNGTPVNALYLQAIVVTVLLIIPGLEIGSIDAFLRFLINMTAATTLLPVLFFVIAYINFRKNHDNIPRTFRLSKNPAVGIAFGILLLILFSLTFVVSIIPDPYHFVLLFQNKPLPADASNPIFSIIYQLGGVVIFLSYAWYLWKKYEKQKVH